MSDIEDKKEKLQKLFDEVLVGGLVSYTWACKNILGLSETEIKEKLKNKK